MNLNYIFLQASTTNLATFIIGLAIVIAVFIALRMVMLWYWRIDTIVENQITTNNLLRKILNEQTRKTENSEID